MNLVCIQSCKMVAIDLHVILRYFTFWGCWACLSFNSFIFSEKKIWKLMLEHLAEIEEKTFQNLLISHLHQFWYTTVWFLILMVYNDFIVKTVKKNYVHVLYTYSRGIFILVSICLYCPITAPPPSTPKNYKRKQNIIGWNKWDLYLWYLISSRLTLSNFLL